jgi:hypothetical protein
LGLALDRRFKRDVGARANTSSAMLEHLRGKVTPLEARLFVEAPGYDKLALWIVIAHANALMKADRCD